MHKPTLSHIKTPRALAALGAFFVPEPLGACLVLAAAVWWLCRKPFQRSGSEIVPQTPDLGPAGDPYTKAVIISADTAPQ